MHIRAFLFGVAIDSSIAAPGGGAVLGQDANPALGFMSICAAVVKAKRDEAGHMLAHADGFVTTITTA